MEQNNIKKVLILGSGALKIGKRLKPSRKKK